jgi:hypothetical protein
MDLMNSMIDTHAYVATVDNGVPVPSLRNEHYHIKRYWIPMCADLEIPADRPFASSLSPAECMFESYLLAFLLIYSYERMLPGHKNRKLGRPADPQSAYQVVSNVNRHLGRHTDSRFSTHQARQALCGLLTEYIDVHGPIQPDRQLPFSKNILAAIYALPNGTVLGSYVLCWNSREGYAIRAVFETSPESGTRLDEVTVSPAKAWTRAKMARSSLSFRIDGVIYADPTAAQLQSLGQHAGDIILLSPATSKCDRWGKRHGGKPIIFPYHADHLYNGCRALVAMELSDPVHGEARKHTPLFRDANSNAFCNHFIRRLLYHMLLHPSVAKHCPYGPTKYSFHSFRRYFASCLGEAGCSKETIQSLCRWLSDEAVEIYNVMRIPEHIATVDAAYNSAPDAITPAILTEMAAVQLDDHALYATWCEDCHIDLTDTVVDPLHD